MFYLYLRQSYHVVKMKILIVSATRKEINPLLKQYSIQAKRTNLFSFRSGKKSVDVLVTGVGMTVTAFHLGKNLSSKYGLAINVGICGSFKKKFTPGTVLNVVNDCFADFGAEDGEKFLTAEEIGLVQGLKVHGSVFKNKMTGGLPKVSSITVNTVHGNNSSIRKVIRKFSPDIESMEGAAFFYACRLNKIPCIQLRAVSNYMEKRSKKNWKTKSAVNNLCSFVMKLIEEL